MPSRSSRLPSAEFRSHGYRTVRTPYFLLKSKRNEAGTVRIGVVAGISVSKKAVRRNFWKRQAKSALTAMATTAAGSEGKDLLVIFSPNADRLTRREFRAAIEKALKE